MPSSASTRTRPSTGRSFTLDPGGVRAVTRPVLLRARGIAKRFGRTEAVRSLDLEVGTGEYFCILGPSGSGKSTLLRILAGFEAPDTGEMHLGGVRLDGLPPERRDTNTVFQGYALFPHLSVFENVAFGLRMKRTPRESLTDRVVEALTLVGLPDFGHRRPSSLSGGEQQRVALARALVNRPALLLLDEPLAALDRKLRIRMQGELARIQAETGVTFIHVTHDQEEALRLADRLAVMNGGRFLQVGTPDEVYHRPRTAFVASFLGSANVLPARTVQAHPFAISPAEGIVLAVAGTPAEGRQKVGAEGRYAIRPEVLRFEALPPTEGGTVPAGDSGTLPNRVAGEVISRRPLGAIEEFRFRSGPLTLTVHVHSSRGVALPASGERATLILHPQDIVPLEAETTEGRSGADSGRMDR